MVKSVALIFACILIGVTGQLLLKTGMSKIGRIDTVALNNPLGVLGKVAANPIIILALGIYILGTLLWLVVLSRENLSFAYPMLGLSYVLIVLVSKLVLGEPVTLTRMIGAATISLGVIIITRS